ALMFVIQKHDATRLHYDFRIELEGVLKSWAVPKGIPTQRGDRRLAMHVEDHPKDYGDFEGVIPEGNYGAGSVMVWDMGTWEPVGEDPLKALQDGKLKFTLLGKKLTGEWTLVRMREREKGKDEWLLVKSGENVRPISARADDQSALTGRTMKQIAGQKTRTWKSHRAASERTANNFRERIAQAVKQARAGKPAKDAAAMASRSRRRKAQMVS
ncbi:MAG TPA: DNA polymerase ligase N-terminal domain-containing protein, partial [Methylomirabilota bacterium]|nr:DNA polymerase ligase N-terminal domain-containing protein [Methylomirabilota bacterium]